MLHSTSANPTKERVYGCNITLLQHPTHNWEKKNYAGASNKEG